MKTLNEINTLGSALFFVFAKLYLLVIVCVLFWVLIRVKGNEETKLRDLRKKE